MRRTTDEIRPSLKEPRAPRARAASFDDLTERYRWTALAVILIGTFMVVLDSTIVSVALDAIGRSLHSSSGIDWIITGYLLVVGVMQPPTGWLADRIGRKPIFLGAMVIFASGSLLTALSPSLPIMIVCRGLQAVGGGAIFPIGMAMVYELFPANRRGTAMGVQGVANMAAPAAGPVIGGWIITSFSWRWLFLINVPIGIAGTILAAILLKNNGFQEARPFDWTGTGLVGSGVLCVLLALSEGASWGWQSTQTMVIGIVGVILLAIFAWWVLRRTKTPVVDIRMFRITTFSLTIAVICLLTLAQYARLVFIPLELESLRRMTALHTGLLLVPGALGAATMMPFAGRLADRIGAKIPVTVGMIPVAAATYYLSTLTPTSSQGWLVFWLFASGAGTGLAMMPNTVVGLNSLPSRLIATGAALRSLSRQMAAAGAVAILTAIVTSQLSGNLAFTGLHTIAQAQAAYNTAFRWGFWAIVATIIVALFLPGRTKAKELQEARMAEQLAMRESGAGAMSAVGGEGD